jgi:hypothetical protein
MDSTSYVHEPAGVHDRPLGALVWPADGGPELGLWVGGLATSRWPASMDPYKTQTRDPLQRVYRLDRLIHELAGGGIRVRPGCGLEETERLTRTISYKKGAAMTVGGGAKGGIDFDPHDERAEGVLRRYLQAMSPLLTTCWATAEDLGVGQDLLNRLFAELGLGMASPPSTARVTPPRELNGCATQCRSSSEAPRSVTASAAGA